MKDASFLGVRGFLTIDEAPVAEQHGLPWLERTVQPFAKALRGWRDVTRDAAHPPLAAQFRIDLRTAVRWISSRAPSRLVEPTENAVVGGVSISFRIWELLVLTVVLQIGMLPLMARDFHRVALSAPVVNLVAVPLTGAVVPLGFLTLGSAFLFPALGRVLALPLGWLTLLLIRSVDWFAHFPRWSYRIPSPPLWLMMTFFVQAVLLCLALRFANVWQGYVAKSLCAGLAGCSLLIALFPFAPKWCLENWN